MGTPEAPAWPDRLLGSGDLPFIGRSRELEELRAAWDRARAGRRSVVIIGGEPGLGKSHLASNAARHCHADGAFVVYGSSFSELGRPFEPIADVLAQMLEPTHELVEVLPSDTVTELARLVVDLDVDRAVNLDVNAGTDHGTDARATAAGDRRRLFDAVVATLRQASERWPLVVVIDDLHWAGRTTLELLDHVIGRTAAERLLILATYRTTAPDHTEDLSNSIGGLLRHAGVSHLDLAGLSDDEVAAFLVAHGTDERHARRAASEVHRQTGGNAFLLRELWRHVDAQGGFARNDTLRTLLPRSIGDTIELRLRSLPKAHLQVLELAAVVGHHGDTALLVDAGDLDVETVLASIGDGVDIGVLRLADPAATSYTFVHDLARRVLIDRLSPGERARLHARVAAALERSSRPHERAATRLVHHWLNAGLYAEAGRALHWLVAAGRGAEHSLAFEEAATHFERAAALTTDDAERAHLMLTAATNSVRSGAFAHGRELFERVADHGDPEVMARAAIGYEDACWRPGLSDERAVQLLERAARALPASHPSRVPVLASLGRSLSFIGRWDQARAIGDAAIAEAREHADDEHAHDTRDRDEMLAIALQASLWCAAGDVTGARQVWLDRAREGGELAERVGHMELLGQAATYRGSLAYNHGHRDEWRVAREQLEIAQRESAQPFYAYMAMCSDHAEAFLHGRFDEAARIADDLLEVGNAFGQDDTDGLYGLQSFMIRRATGRIEEIRPLITGDEPLDGNYWAPGLLAIYCALGMHDPAHRVLEHVLASDLESERHGSQWHAMTAFLVDAVADLGHERGARILLPFIEPLAGTNMSAGHFVAVFGSANRYLAMLLGITGSSEVDRYFEMALEMDRGMDAPVHVAETLARWSDALRERDPDASHARRAEAHELATRLGMRPLAARTAAAPDPAVDGGEQDPSDRVTERPDGLSPREVEVLRCLARGCSNREIAAELFIAENTAANHVRNIMMKTGSANRTQAAIYAARRSLV